MVNRVITIALISIFASVWPVLAAADKSDAVIAADKGVDQALAEADVSASEAALDPQFSWTDRKGMIHSRAQILTHLTRTGSVAQGSNVQIRRYGRLALVFGDQHLADQNVDVHFLHVYVRRTAGWKAFSFRENTILPKRTPLAAANTPPAHAAPTLPCENPCKRVPYVPRTRDERAVLDAYMRLETASAAAHLDTYVAQLADELLIVNTNYSGTPTTKAIALAVHKQQKVLGTTGSPASLAWARIAVFGDAATMDSRQGRASGPATLIFRVWVKRAGRWQLAYSQQTRTPA